jgi:starch synthase
MKIVLVSLARRGGMLHFQVELANSLARIASTAVVMSTAAPASYLEKTVHKSVVPTGRGAPGSLASALNPAVWYALWKGLADSRPDLVHVTGAHAWNPIVAILSRLQGKPLLYTLHDPEEHRGAPALIRLSNWVTTRMANAVIVLTMYGRQQLVSRGLPPEKVHVIPHGVYSFFRKWRRNDMRARKIILYFGRFEPYKGLDVLVEAFGRVRQAIPGWKLVLAGNGRFPPSVDGARQPDVAVLSGYVPDEEVAGLMQRAGLVVVPYTTASQSGVIATAYAFGRAVIATSVGGLAEMVVDGKTGLLIPPNNVDALVRAIKSLTTDPGLRRRMGRNAYARGRKVLNWDRIAEMHVKLYLSILAERQY